ncbi:hypothetical protein MSj_00040 [Microcystis aeruginosa Sj]|jgi:ABC-type glutathione transport system ATPase component|uniref:Uncharacterized protein n=1 Tax=Microcystis aeruginosa Sj TaxID=1979544 RepID=A0A2Z6UCQ6_MICAE|nr:hypothetical protein MSj_00040 [Microcystis aeruginosa Sj]
MGFAEKLFQQTLFSHRLALCPLPDTIIVLENGKISEVGSPAELMSKRRRYYLMFTRQANSYQSKKPGVQGRLNCGRNPTLAILVQFPSLTPE